MRAWQAEARFGRSHAGRALRWRGCGQQRAEYRSWRRPPRACNAQRPRAAEPRAAGRSLLIAEDAIGADPPTTATSRGAALHRTRSRRRAADLRTRAASAPAPRRFPRCTERFQVGPRPGVFPSVQAQKIHEADPSHLASLGCAVEAARGLWQREAARGLWQRPAANDEREGEHGANLHLCAGLTYNDIKFCMASDDLS